MGACSGSDTKDDSSVQSSQVNTGFGNIPDLEFEKVLIFLMKYQRHPVSGPRFASIGPSRLVGLAKKICTMLNYAFTHDTICPFEDLLKMHSMMGITKEQLDKFCDLFLEECVYKGSASVQVKIILERIKVFIMHRHKRMVDERNVIKFFQALRTHPLLKDRFGSMTPNQIKQIIEKFINILNSDLSEKDLMQMGLVHQHLYISEVEFDEFVTLLEDTLVLKVTPTLVLVKPYIMKENGNTVMRLVNSLKANPVLKRFTELPTKKLREIIVVTLELAKRPKWIFQMERLVSSHQELMISAEEFNEYEKEFLLIHPENEEFKSNVKAVIGEMRRSCLSK